MKNTRLVCALMVCGWVMANGASGAEGAGKLPEKKVRIPGVPNTTLEIELVQIPAGQVALPSHKEGESPRTVQVKSIWVQKAEMDWPVYFHWAWGREMPEEEQLKAINAKTIPTRPYAGWDSGWGTDGMPAMRMTYHAAEMHCKWLTVRTGKKFRLPTEAEWEYAARAGGPPIEKLGDEALKRVAWQGGNSEEQTHTCGTKAPNAWGLYDMLGNVAEYVQNDDPGKPPFAKGGSWATDPGLIGTTLRQYWNKKKWQGKDSQDPPSIWWLSTGDFVGYRVVCED